MIKRKLDSKHAKWVYRLQSNQGGLCSFSTTELHFFHAKRTVLCGVCHSCRSLIPSGFELPVSTEHRAPLGKSTDDQREAPARRSCLTWRGWLSVRRSLLSPHTERELFTCGLRRTANRRPVRAGRHAASRAAPATARPGWPRDRPHLGHPQQCMGDKWTVKNTATSQRGFQTPTPLSLFPSQGEETRLNKTN